MKHDEWVELSRKMAIEAIVMDLADTMTPCSEGRPIAIKALDDKNQDALNIEYRMGQSLISLKKLGYKIIKD